MSWEQNILTAQVSVNRCGWALNVRSFNNNESDFKNIDERNGYIKQEAREAIKVLSQALVELENQLNFVP